MLRDVRSAFDTRVRAASILADRSILFGTTMMSSGVFSISFPDILACRPCGEKKDQIIFFR
jgi:hypothetical protein